MAGMTIRNMDEPLKTRLRLRAAAHGRSMEEEARDILRVALSSESDRSGNLVERIRHRMKDVGGIDLPVSRREAIRDVPDFGQ